MKKALCFILALAMLTVLFAGCSNAVEETSTPESEAPVESAASTETETPEADAPADADAPAEEPEAEVPSITYPLQVEDPTLTMWYYIPPYTHVADSNYSFFCIPYAEEATGVHLDFVEAGQQVASEQFNLMIASEEWTDIIPANEYYTGGLVQAYEDEVIIDLQDLMAENMPDFMKYFNEQTKDVQRAAYTDEKMLAFINIADGTYSGNGIVTRGDWIDELGWTWSGDTITLDEYVDYLKAVEDKYNPDMGYMFEPTAQISSLADWFDVSIPTLYEGFMSVIGPQLFRRDNVVTSSWIEDGYREYLTWVMEMFDEGILPRNFLETSTDRLQQNSMCGTGKVASWQANADKMDECGEYADEANANWEARAVPKIVSSEDGTSPWLDEVNLISKGMSVSSTSEKAELACQWMNYFWTEPGIMMVNYGIEGETYAIDENGEIQWLDMIINNPNIGNAEMGVSVYTYSRFGTSYMDNDRLLSTFTPTALAAVETWTIEGTSDRAYPSVVSLTTDEQDRVTKVQNDVLTYAQETVLKFLSSELELNDENWNNYCEQLKTMGLTEIMEIYQVALDEYLAGER